jgi:hypothetical protein
LLANAIGQLHVSAHLLLSQADPNSWDARSC